MNTPVTYDPSGLPIATIDLSQIHSVKELREVTEAIVEQLVLPSNFSHSSIHIEIERVDEWTKMSPYNSLKALNGHLAAVQQIATYSANVLADKQATVRPVVTIEIK